MFKSLKWKGQFSVYHLFLFIYEFIQKKNTPYIYRYMDEKFFNMCDNIMCLARLYLLSMSSGCRWLCLLILECPIFLSLDH